MGNGKSGIMRYCRVHDKICFDVESAADIIMSIGESASIAWTKEQLIEWLESDIGQDGG